MTRVNRLAVGALAALLPSCGGGGGGPATPSSPPPAGGSTVTAIVFYDRNANGIQDPADHAVPDVDVVIGGRTGRSAVGSGAATVANVPAGVQQVSLRAESIPPFYRAGALPVVTAPSGDPVRIPLTVAIGNNRPDYYVAFGDSITRGESVTPAQAYPARLQSRLIAHFGDAFVNNRGGDATNTFEGLERYKRNVPANEPAFVLILYGTNDWHDPVCQDITPSCHTVPNLRQMVRMARAEGTQPFLATIIPTNPALTPQGRNDWVDVTNTQIKAMAAAEGAFLVDLNQAFKNQPNLPALFSDDVHPNAAGYDLIAQGFFEAIAHGRAVP
jgi:lysophospholipase L1-like esterase